ncbi:chromate transporter [Ideonella sp. YS5]|uniref:chromate transporter n=1 Tax=Ideonella sp. YS5 TaxID=3453714 RepID=UPI003EEC721C
MNLADLFSLFVHCATLSLLAIGGAIATVPDLQRFVVVEHGWLQAADFTASVALAQAAPGPNLLFVAVVGFNALGLPGAMAAMAGILLPSTTLTLFITRWGSRRRDTRGVKAFVAGMAPITLGLLVSTGWLLASPVVKQPVAVLLVLATVATMWRTRLSPLWLLACGALAGSLGWV